MIYLTLIAKKPEEVDSSKQFLLLDLDGSSCLEILFRTLYFGLLAVSSLFPKSEDRS